MGMGLRVDVRVYSKRDTGFDLENFATDFNGLQFALGFDIEQEYVAVQRLVNLSVLLTDS